ncbi:MAG: methyltransferase [Gemmataceae bacterium]
MSEALSPRIRMLQMCTGYWISQAIYVAAKLKIADHIKAGIRTPADLAAKSGAQVRPLYRLLRALASVEVFAEEADGGFALTPLAEQLTDELGSMRAPAIMMGDEHYASWGQLEHSVRTGEPAFDRIYGKPIFQYLGEQPEQAKIFDAAMTGIHGPETPAMVDAYDFSGIQTLVDVGGGNGSLLSAVLRKYPGMKGILFDLPQVVERAKDVLRGQGVADRVRCEPGNFYEGTASGGDAYMMRHILHDWTDEQCGTILGHIRKAIPNSGRLIVIECVIQPGNMPSWGKFLDLNMLVLPGGQERTEAEFRTLLEKAGFRLEKVVPTRTEVSVIEARPV